ncbi:SDR family oxidoreductase [Saccharopolyspora phatthalungensis]|uniref:3-oxoacyl-[acyl-carrier protein] reductase n=1 Tax=Saccharopolyspora phatthalungensis TaxID=664693 RepID=A0A840QB05_9PSEU|nr:SDR family oxidoreductase [Saccharopolyspora phatthalungensis]MBB5156961.1 3-oxoacyl-[acyl-carrier protein] reductase [Saccharopolyspora phatthalungensis]
MSNVKAADNTSSGPIRPEPRVALVGGGAGGIGTAIAASLRASGHDVILAGRTESTLAAAAAALGPGTGHVVCDLADPADAAAAVEQVHQSHGALDVVVANAGGPAPGGVLDVPHEQWHHDLDLLVLGPLALMRSALPSMAERGFGRIVLVTSTAVRQPQPGLAASTVLRTAATAAAKLAARECASRGVTVNCVAVGATDTPRRIEVVRHRALVAGVDLSTALAQDTVDIPAGRAADPEEIAAAVNFLASPEASYVNGTVLTVDGGRTEYLL